MSTRLLRCLSMLPFFLPLGFGLAQQPVPPPQELRPEVALEELKTRCAGLTQEELKPELDAWQRLVQAKESELVAALARRRQASGAERERLEEVGATLRDQRNALVDRIEVVIAAFKNKGGDAATYEAYIANLPTHVDFRDPSALWTWFRRWITSPEGGLKWGLNALVFLLILVGFKLLSNLAGKVTVRALKASRLKVSELLRDFFANSVRKIIIFIGVVIALGQIGVDIGPLLAGIGVVGFVVGFALQGTLSNFASGIMILLYRPYDLGDFINGAGVTGKVSAMTLVSTTLTTPDNQVVVIPNSSIWGNVITNITGSTTRRVDLTFGVGYADDLAKVEKILEALVAKHPLTLNDPAPTIRVHELAESSVNFVVRPWVKTADYWTVYWDLTRQVKERFDAEGISIPFPQRDVHLRGQAASIRAAG